MQEVRAIPTPLPRARDAHKGSFGHLLVLAGSLRMTGAALLTTGAGLRSGAGLVTLGMPAGLHPLIAPAMLAAMSLPLPPDDGTHFSPPAVEPALAFADGVTALALGPGISTAEPVVKFVREIALNARVPAVIDADGLNCLALSGADLSAARGPRVLTPHPGEAARLLGISVGEVQADRRAAAARLALGTSSLVALKGRGTVVTDGVRCFVNETGNPGMATGGTGDVLTGLIGGLLAGRMSPFDATVLGVHLHGLAGDLAASHLSEQALTAPDLLDHLGPAFLALRGS